MYGYWYAFGFFPPRSLKEGKSAILEEIEGLVGEEGVTLVESEEKKIELTGRFPVMFDRRETFAALALKASEQGLPEEYWDTYVERINNLTRKEVNDALQKYIHPKKLGMATVGDVGVKKKKGKG
jgi:zinc protease